MQKKIIKVIKIKNQDPQNTIIRWKDLKIINKKIKTQIQEMPLEKARETGAEMLFGEKYDQEVSRNSRRLEKLD